MTPGRPALDAFREFEDAALRAVARKAAETGTKWTKACRTKSGTPVQFVHDEGTGKFPLWFERLDLSHQHGPVIRYSRTGKAMTGGDAWDLDAESVPVFDR